MSDHIIKISRSAASAVFSGREVALPEMLDARERRVYRQQQLLQEYGKPLLCFTMNIAGPVKNSEMIRDGFDLGCEMLKANLAPAGGTARTGASSSGGIPVLFSEEVHEITGNEALYVVDADPLEVKKITTAIEDGSDLGRLFDRTGPPRPAVPDLRKARKRMRPQPHPQRGRTSGAYRGDPPGCGKEAFIRLRQRSLRAEAEA